MSTQGPRSHASSSFSSSSPRRPTLPQVESTLEDEGENEWDNVRSEFLNVLDERGRSQKKRKGRKKKDEPMKPITVVLYVIFFYLIWQILTRSTDTEILSHLAPSSPHYYSSHSLPESPPAGSTYHLPYQFPHIPSPLPPTTSSSGTGESPGFFRLILGIIAYPLYLVITLLASPIPIILNILHILAWILGILLLPFTSTSRILGRVFVYTPYTWVRAVGVALYPVYVFVGGMLGVGCVMGLGAGWAGRKGVEYLTRGRDGKTGAKDRDLDSRRSGSRLGGIRQSSTSHIARHRTPELDLHFHSIHPQPSSLHSSSRESTPPNPHTPISYRPTTAPSLFPEDSISRKGGTRVHVKLVDGEEGDKTLEKVRTSMGKGTGREGGAVGTRRRGVRYRDH